MIQSIGHIALRVHNLDSSLTFYSKLGIHEHFRLHREDGSLMLVYLKVAPEQFIELFPGGEFVNEDSRGFAKQQRGESGFFHLCLHTEDLVKTVEDLKLDGVKIEREIKMGLDHNLQAWLSDPDGNLIELMQLSDDSPQRKLSKEEKR